jgi:spore maturation protein CgeB
VSRFLVAHPGAETSTHDVAVGYCEALSRLGHDIGLYALDARLTAADRYLRQQLRIARLNDPTLPRRPGFGDVTLKASEDLVLAALRGRVDAVLVISGLFVNPNGLRLLRAARVPAGVIFTESPYQDDEQAECAGLVSCCWTNERTSVAPLRRANARTWYLPGAYRTGFHAPSEPDPTLPSHDVVFVGSYFPERIDLLAAADWTGIDLGLYGNLDGGVRRSAGWRKLRRFARGGSMSNAAATALYQRAAVCLNLNRTCTWVDGAQHVLTAESLNPRAYELAACGAFTVAQARAEGGELFGESVPTFDTAEQLTTLVQRALAYPGWRAAAAAEARRAVGPHTFDARAAQVVAQLSAAVLSNPFVAPRQAAAD